MSKQFYFRQFSLAEECSLDEVHSLNVKTVLFQVIRFSISTQFSSIWCIDKTLSRTRVNMGSTAIKGYSTFSKFQNYWSLTIRLFSVISRTLVRGVLSFCKKTVCGSCSPSWLGNDVNEEIIYTAKRIKHPVGIKFTTNCSLTLKRL